jgi:hypothetical protein
VTAKYWIHWVSLKSTGTVDVEKCSSVPGFACVNGSSWKILAETLTHCQSSHLNLTGSLWLELMEGREDLGID